MTHKPEVDCTGTLRWDRLPCWAQERLAQGYGLLRAGEKLGAPSCEGVRIVFPIVREQVASEVEGQQAKEVRALMAALLE